MKLTEIQLEIKRLTEMAERLENEEWPREGDTVFFVDMKCRVRSTIWENDATDKALEKTHNRFRTEAGAQKEADLTLLWREMRAFAEQENGEWVHKEGDVYWALDNQYYCYSIPFQIKFKTKESAQKALDKFGERLKKLNN